MNVNLFFSLAKAEDKLGFHLALGGGGHRLRRRRPRLLLLSLSIALLLLTDLVLFPSIVVASRWMMTDVSSFVFPSLERRSSPPSSSALCRSSGDSGCRLTIFTNLSALCRRSFPPSTPSVRRSTGVIWGCRFVAFTTLSALCRRTSSFSSKVAHTGLSLGFFSVASFLSQIYKPSLAVSLVRSRSSLVKLLSLATSSLFHQGSSPLSQSAHPGFAFGSFYVGLSKLQICNPPLAENLFQSRSSADILPPIFPGVIRRRTTLTLLANYSVIFHGSFTSEASSDVLTAPSGATLSGFRSVIFRESCLRVAVEPPPKRTPCDAAAARLLGQTRFLTGLGP